MIGPIATIEQWQGGSDHNGTGRARLLVIVLLGILTMLLLLAVQPIEVRAGVASGSGVSGTQMNEPATSGSYVTERVGHSATKAPVDAMETRQRDACAAGATDHCCHAHIVAPRSAAAGVHTRQVACTLPVTHVVGHSLQLPPLKRPPRA